MNFPVHFLLSFPSILWFLICPVQPQNFPLFFVSSVIFNLNYFSANFFLHCFFLSQKTFSFSFSPFTVLPNFPVNCSHLAVHCQPFRNWSHVSLILGSMSCRWWKSLFDFEPETSPRANIFVTRKPYSRSFLHAITMSVGSAMSFARDSLFVLRIIDKWASIELHSWRRYRFTPAMIFHLRKWKRKWEKRQVKRWKAIFHKHSYQFGSRPRNNNWLCI